MFNLKSRFSKAKRTIVQAVNTPKDPQVIIAEIHAEFDTASERLLKEAKVVLAGSYDLEKGKRLAAIGFVQSKTAVESDLIAKDIAEKTRLSERIEYYKQNYPTNKFITEKEVERICKKYGLLKAATEYYISDVPEKNLLEIESFKLREEDMRKSDCGWYTYDTQVHYYRRAHSSSDFGATYGYFDYSNRIMGGDLIRVHDESVRFVYIKSPLQICASVKDFDTKNMRIESGYKLEVNLPDPIVLQPVSDGYLVVTKWGLESEDELLVNEKMN